MEISSDSDDDDCQLYTRTADHFTKKRNEIQSKRKLLEDEDTVNQDLVLADADVFLVNGEDAINSSKFVDNSLDADVSLNSFQDPNSSEDDIPLAELRRSLRNKKRKIPCSPQLQVRPRSRRKSRKQRNRETSRPTGMSPARNGNVVVLDDDLDFVVGSFPPIDFNSRSNKKSISSKDISIENINLDLDDEDDFESDDLVTLTIEWNNNKTTTLKHFKIRRYQKLESVFEELSKLENINSNRVLLMYDFKSVSPMDTPSSLNLKFYGALIGSVSSVEVNHNKANVINQVDDEKSSGPTGGIQVKLLLQSKQTLVFKVFKRQKMDILYTKCAEELKCNKGQLKITFDGEHVEPNEVLEDLDVEDGDVFHVHVKSCN
ncbi:DNA repair protein Rad60 [Macrosteles quadrilineatus]|uniref:DNA repair protein Rad60 n=1 Tax=Macrosteles quadrilineatus TaxID=74068 RepID=UPI0023E2225F|nr:DNA repair protein Rad60 [Macrosteles quadrilineatus]